jgi:acyl-coenzyme A synthetase/AMP-(fatty) acid ligase
MNPAGAVTEVSLASQYRSSGIWPDRLITDDLDAYAKSRSGHVVVIDSRQSMTYAQLQDSSYRVAAGLLSLGVKPNDRVAIQLPNWSEYVVLHCALVRIGAVTCLITPMSRARDVSGMLRVAQCKWLVIPRTFKNFDYLSMGLQLRSTHADLGLILVDEDPGQGETLDEYDKVYPWNSILQTPCDRDLRETINQMRPHPDEVTEIVFTSGTTGDPKGVMHTNNTLYAPQVAMSKSLDLRRGSVLHMASTLGHQTGFLNGIRLPIQVGGAVVLQDTWKPEAFVELVAQYKIEVSSGSATFLMDILKASNLEAFDVSSLRVFRAGGGPIPVALVKEAESRLPNLKVLRGWGQTENGVVTLTRLDDDLETRAQTDGRVQPGMALRIVNVNQQELGTGVEGSLQVRGAFMSPGYANSPDLMKTFYFDDWFDTGDLATIDTRGYIKITGRLKDIVIRGGENIPIHYVENVLFEDVRIAEVSIVGMPDERLGERCCAFVILKKGAILSLYDMQVFLSSREVATQYWPERLEIVDELPRTANGKVQKASLRGLLLKS